MTALNSPITINEVIQKVNENTLPDTTGHTGEFLKSGSDGLEWDSVDALPAQAGNAGKLLTTDGTDASWLQKEYMRSLSTAQATQITTDGTYNGEEVANGEVFTSVDGKFLEFNKEQQSVYDSDEYTGGIWGAMSYFKGYLFSTILNGNGFSPSISQDGKTWSSVTDEGFGTGGGAYMQAFASQNTAMLVRIQENTTTLSVFKTTTGNIWTTDTITVPKYVNGCNSLVFGSIWILRSSSSSNNDSYIYSNNDGVSWTEVNYPETISGNRYLFVVGNKLLLMDSSGHIFESENASSWTSKGTTSLPTTGFGAGSYYFYTVGQDLYKSTDGINGTKIGTIPITDKTYTRGTYANGVYVIYGENEVSVSYDDATTFESEYRYTLSGGGNLYGIPTDTFIYVCSWVWGFQGTAYYCSIVTTPSYSLTPLSLSKTEVNTALSGKQATLTAGTGIDITGNVISATGGGSDVSLSDIAEAGDGIKFDDGRVVTENFTKTGTPTITDGVASGFGASSYLTADYTFNVGNSAWELDGSVTTTNTSAYQYFLGNTNNESKTILIGIEAGELHALFSSDGNNWGDTTGSGSWVAVSANTKYYFKYIYDGDGGYSFSVSTDKENWTTHTWTGSAISSTSPVYIGSSWDRSFSPLQGSVDLNDYSIKVNGTVVWTPYTITTNDKTEIKLDIGTGSNAPQQSTEGYVGKLYITTSGNIYLCTDISGSTYTWQQISIVPKLGNFTVVGSPTISSNELTGSTSSDYIVSDKTMSCSGVNWELHAKIATGADVNTEQKFVVSTEEETVLGIKNGKWWFKNPYGNKNETAVAANTTYWVICQFYGSGYRFKVSTDGVNYSNASAIITYGTSMDGKNILTSNFDGTIYLENLKFYAGGTLYWEAIDSE